MFSILIILFLFDFSNAYLWKNGVVHFSINDKDYDTHSRDVIQTAIRKVEAAICVKFFKVAKEFDPDKENKILFIHNRDKVKECEVPRFNYSANVVELVIGYKCLNEFEVANYIVALLRSGILENSTSSANTFDVWAAYRNKKNESHSLITEDDRNYINLHYASECSDISGKDVDYRRFPWRLYQGGVTGDDYVPTNESDIEMFDYYTRKRWPLGIVMYGVDKDLMWTPEAEELREAMTSIELDTCVVFQEVDMDDVLSSHHVLWFTDDGDDEPALGFLEGKQTINLYAMVHGAPGHTAHTLAMLLRAVGFPMVSNRPDRNNYVKINWKYVQKGKEHLLEKVPYSEGWVRFLPYDFESATHAPANFVCDDAACALGAQTVTPLMDHLWQRTLTMGHRTTLSDGDKHFMKILYAPECQRRLLRQADSIFHMPTPKLTPKNVVESIARGHEATLRQRWLPTRTRHSITKRTPYPWTTRKRTTKTARTTKRWSRRTTKRWSRPTSASRPTASFQPLDSETSKPRNPKKVPDPFELYT